MCADIFVMFRLFP